MTEIPTSMWVVAGLSLILTLVWIVWGVGQYRKTGRAQWLIMALAMTVGVLGMFSGLMRR